MDKASKLAYQQRLENYLESKQIYNLFENLLQSVVIAKPSDPLAFLIEKLSFPPSKLPRFPNKFAENSQESLHCGAQRPISQGNRAGTLRFLRIHVRFHGRSAEEGTQQENRRFPRDFPSVRGECLRGRRDRLAIAEKRARFPWETPQKLRGRRVSQDKSPGFGAAKLGIGPGRTFPCECRGKARKCRDFVLFSRKFEKTLGNRRKLQRDERFANKNQQELKELVENCWKEHAL